MEFVQKYKPGAFIRTTHRQKKIGKGYCRPHFSIEQPSDDGMEFYGLGEGPTPGAAWRTARLRIEDELVIVKRANAVLMPGPLWDSLGSSVHGNREAFMLGLEMALRFYREVDSLGLHNLGIADELQRRWLKELVSERGKNWGL